MEPETSAKSSKRRSLLELIGVQSSVADRDSGSDKDPLNAVKRERSQSFTGSLKLNDTRRSSSLMSGENPLNLKATSFRVKPIGAQQQQAVPILRFSRKGGIIGDTVVKVDMAKKVGLHMRDVRILEEAAANRIAASLHGHGNVILMSLEGIKLMITKDEALLFSPDYDPAKLFMKNMTLQFEEYTVLRFEHEVIEMALNTAVVIISNEFLALRTEVESALSSQRDNTEIQQIIHQATMFPKKSKLQLLKKRTQEIIRALTAIQSDDTHISKMVIADPSDAVSTGSSSASPQSNPSFSPFKASAPGGKGVSWGSTAEVITTTAADTRMASIDRDEDRPSMVAPTTRTPFKKEVSVGFQVTQSPPLSPYGRMSIERENFRPSDFNGQDDYRPSISLRTSRTNFGQAKRRATTKKRSSVIPKRDFSLDVELILDNSIISLNWLSSDIDDLIEKLVATEADASLQVDIMRNRIMRYNTYLTLATFSVALTAIIPGIFGMNLLFPSNLYDDKSPFFLTCSLIAIAIPLVFVILVYIGKARHIF